MKCNRAKSIAQYCAMAATPCAMADIQFEELNTVLNYNDPNAAFTISAGYLADVTISIGSTVTNTSSSNYGNDWAWGYWHRVNRAVSMAAQPGWLDSELRMGVDGDSIKRLNAGEQIYGDMDLASQGDFAVRTNSWGLRGVRHSQGGTGTNTFTETTQWDNSDITGIGRFYIGFKLTEQIMPDATYYGWIDFEVTMDNMIVHGYAYETSGGAIAAGHIPAPSALGLLGLAAGAAGIRRKRAG